MAKLPGFTADLSYVNAPAAPNPAVVEAAYAAEARGLDARAKGIEIAAARRGEAVGALAKLAETGYTMKVEQEARTAVQDVVNKLNTPEFGFVGETAAAAPRLGREATDQLQTQFQDMGELTNESFNQYVAKAQQIQANVQQNMLSQAQAQTILASDMKRLIAENPMMADRIRKVYNSHTGRGDWDVRPVETALTAKAKEDEAQKAMISLLKSDAEKIFNSGVGNNFGMKSSAEIFQHLVNRTDTGVRMATAVQANALIEHTNKAMTIGSMNEFFSNATIGAQAARVEVNTRLQQQLLAEGLDLSKPIPQLTEAHRALITNAYVQSKQAERNALEGARAMLTDRLRANPGMDANIVASTMKLLDAQLANTPTTASFDDMLNTLKADATSKNVNAQTLVAIQQLRDLALKTTWGDDLINMAKDPGLANELRNRFPGNEAVDAFVNEFEQRRGNYAEQMRRYAMIADGMTNPNAPMEHRAAYEAAKTTPEGKRRISDVIQLNMFKGANVLTRGNAQTASDVTNIIILGRNFVPEGENFSALQRSVTTGTWEGMFPTADTRAKDEFVKATTGRIATWLNGNDPNSYLTALKNTVANIPGATMSVQSGALVVTPPAGADPVTVIAMNGQLNTVNSLIRMQNTLLKRDDIASTLITSTPRQMEVGAPTQPPTAPITPGATNVREGVIRQGGEPYNLAPRNPLATQGGPAIPAGSEAEMARRATAAREINAARTGGTNAPTQTPTTPSVVSTANSTTPWWRQ